MNQIRPYILLLLLAVIPYAGAETVTYRIISRTVVEAEGVEPYGSVAYYEQTGTGQKGQMTAGNSTTLLLTGYSMVQINRISVMVRTNKSSGSGELDILLNDKAIQTLTSDNFFTDSPYTLEFKPVTFDFSPAIDVNNEELVVYATANQNSLYVESYTIDYVQLELPKYTVSFATHVDNKLTSLSETEAGGGVLLPTLDYDKDEWHFAGWLQDPIITPTAAIPALYKSGRRFYPQGDVTLHAVYADGADEPLLCYQDTTFESGLYVLADAYYKRMASGGVDSGKIYTDQLSMSLDEQMGLYTIGAEDFANSNVYYIDFMTEDSATIYSVSDQTFVGWPSSSIITLTKMERAWNYRIEEKYAVRFYHEYSSDIRELRATTGNTVKDIDKITYRNTLEATASYNVLFRVDNLPEPIVMSYTSYPEGVDDALNEPELPIVLLGDGLLNPGGLVVDVYSLQGVRCIHSKEDVSFDKLSAGIYILSVGNRSCKILIP